MNRWLTPGSAGVLALAGLAALGAVARRNLIIVTVVGDSMSPTLNDGSRLLAYRSQGGAVGDLIIFDNPIRYGELDPSLLVKRIRSVEPIRDSRQSLLWVVAEHLGGVGSGSFGPIHSRSVKGRVCRKLPDRGSYQLERRTTKRKAR